MNRSRTVTDPVARQRTQPVPRRLGRVDLHNLPAWMVITTIACGLVYAAAVPPHWLRGMMVLAGAMLLAALFRLVLPARQAGLLAVRGRFVDLVFYGGIGAMIIFLGVTLAAAGSS